MNHGGDEHAVVSDGEEEEEEESRRQASMAGRVAKGFRRIVSGNWLGVGGGFVLGD